MTETESAVRRDVLEYSKISHEQGECDPRYDMISRCFDESDESDYVSWNLSFDQAQTTGEYSTKFGVLQTDWKPSMMFSRGLFIQLSVMVWHRTF